MTMLREIKKVEYISGYKLKLYFTNGKVKIFDMEDLLRTAKNVFLPLKEIDFFKKVQCNYGTIVWPNGVDLCPDVLYKKSKDISSPRGKKRKLVRAKLKKKLHPSHSSDS